MPQQKAKPVAVSIRWLIRRDMAEVLDIENACFGFPWDEQDFLCCLRQRNCIGMVAEDADKHVIAFMIYELHKSNLRLLSFAVYPTYWRQGVGRAMAQRLIDKLSQQRRSTITLEVREGNLPGQLFWKSMGFKCLGVMKDRYDDCDEDAYLMRYVLPEAMGPAEKWHPTNRMTEYLPADE